MPLFFSGHAFSEENPSYMAATDTQIVEAQRFYKHCQNNVSMSARKDCKCAAAVFLETRMELGDSASVDTIIDENINTCLLDSKKNNIDAETRLEAQKITEQQKQEAQGVYDSCMIDRAMQRNTDCECLAAKFLDLRLKRGPMADRDILILNITQHGCRNVVETTGLAYGICMQGSSFDYNGIRPKDYCECYARRWGELFEKYTGKMDEYKKESMRLHSRLYCKNPESYKK